MDHFLDTFADFLRTRQHHIHRIATYTPAEGISQISLLPATPCQNIYSIAKIFTDTAIGILVDRGLLSTGDTVISALGTLSPDTYDPLWEHTTVDMLLKHYVGLPKGFLDVDCQDANTFGEDFLAYVMNHPLQPDHGTAYHYTDASHYILSCIAENCTGMPLDTFLWQELFRPMAFRDVAWSHCPRRHVLGATGLHLRIEDMIKLGGLYLQKGVWQEQRILSEKWVETAVYRQYDFSPRGAGNAYGKGGMLGQKLLVFPEQQRVVAWQAASGLGQEDIVEFLCQL